MRDSHHLSDIEKQIAYIMRTVSDDEARELARLAVMLHVMYGDTMTTQARRTFDDLLRGIGPDFLLTFRALRMRAREIVRSRRNWRQRS